ncbi:MAG: ATP synthase F0 subunit B [Actinobacteria bacterium]|nr:ATP synthase F0 subunit B [Actinomycetota bacterium]MDA3016805.1 ATP synthase F0 subunit B [Actinomycetota bacterium]
MNLVVTSLFAVEDPSQTHHWLLPETAEIVYGGIASCIIFFGLYKFGWPMIVKSMNARTARIQKELDGAADARSKSETDAAGIRTALGDIESERRKILAEADAQATAIMADGRARLLKEVADLEVKASADLAAARGRSGEELRGEIARLSSAAISSAVAASLNERAQQELIENFIKGVGAAK